MGRLIDWSLDQIGRLPSVPLPFLIACAIVFLIVFPTVRKAWKAHVPDVPKPIEAVPIVQMQASGVYTILTNMQLSIEETKLDVKDLSGKVDILLMMARRRAARGKSLK